MPSSRLVVGIAAAAVVVCLTATVLSLATGQGLPVVPAVLGAISLVILVRRRHGGRGARAGRQ